MAPTSMSSGTADPALRTGRAPKAPLSLRLDDRPLPVVGTARVYTCGITPYDVTHLGHAATFVWADVLTSVLASTGVDVHSCRNITDVDDVLTTAARERGRYYDEFALTQEAVFDHSMRALRVATPAAQPRARHHVDAVQQLAQGLLAAGAAYERDGTVWFRGPAPGAGGGRGGTPSAPRWRCACRAPRSTCWSAATTWSSPTTPTRARWSRR